MSPKLSHRASQGRPAGDPPGSTTAGASPDPGRQRRRQAGWTTLIVAGALLAAPLLLLPSSGDAGEIGDAAVESALAAKLRHDAGEAAKAHFAQLATAPVNQPRAQRLVLPPPTTTTTTAPPTTTTTTAPPPPPAPAPPPPPPAPPAPPAPTGSVWDSLAQCESGGNWASSVGTYEGGLQFLNSTWLANGGGQYAQHAYGATREQQIAVAETLLARTGGRYSASWPGCSSKLGLP